MNFAPTQPSSCSECSMFGVARGFVLGAGTPEKARYMCILEAPGKDELSFALNPNPKRAFLQTIEECEHELAIRKRDYPELSNGHLRYGVPAVGATGLALIYWLWQKVGIRRDEVFLDNTIRCLSPKSKAGAAYPTGVNKKSAELHCRQYDRIHLFKPDCVILTIHPASLLREVTPLPLCIKDWEKARDFAAQGRRVLVLVGGKSAQAFLRYGQNSTRWRGHFSALSENWIETYKTLFEYQKKERKNAVRKQSKRKKASEEVLPGEQGVDQGEAAGIQSDSSIDASEKKTQSRATKRVRKKEPRKSKSSGAEICQEVLAGSTSIFTKDKISGI
jgi:uracil-DNA glycosylase